MTIFTGFTGNKNILSYINTLYMHSSKNKNKKEERNKEIKQAIS